MSRPSITMPFSLPIFCCWATSFLRTNGSAAMGLTCDDTSRVRISRSTFSPLRYVSGFPVLSFSRKEMSMSFIFCSNSSAFTLPSSSNKPLRSANRVTDRYIAPVSTYIYPISCARSFAIVDLPHEE